MQSEVSEKGGSFAAEDKVQELQDINRELYSQIDMLIQTIDRQERKNLSQKEQIDELLRQIEQLKSSQNALQDNLNQIVSSRSWMITAPIRAILSLRR